MSSNGKGIDFLCGKIVEVRLRVSGSVAVFTRDDMVMVAPGQRKAISKIIKGRRRMLILHDGVVIGIFGRPRIRLHNMILRGAPITEEVIECSGPMYPKDFDDLMTIHTLSEFPIQS